MEQFGLTWDRVREANPRILMVRMPAFGLSGPWRDRTGFAQTMEQLTGMAWMTGYSDGPPVVPRGPCDALAGIHATFAVLAALNARERDGRGRLIESTMVEAALNVTVEMALEYQVYGVVLERDRNRGPVAVPQGLYRCAGTEQWVALAIVTDEHWEALTQILGAPSWATAPQLATGRGRRAAHDFIDGQLASWFAEMDLATVVEELVGRGVPAASAVDPRHILDNPQLRARGFIESFDHPVIGQHETMGMPFHLSSYEGPWIRTPSPTLGQHNSEVLSNVVGLSEEEINDFRWRGINGENPLPVV
jgi:crotonobetainyl-CoA:carnitine CoA-transferase CaiB-like acyl-CoA transferase